MDETKSGAETLEAFYRESGFESPLSEAAANTYKAYLGPLLIDVPNTPKRRQLVLYHDLHHLLTGYDNSRVGEGEIGAWELGTGLWRWPLVLGLNWGGMATGIWYAPGRTWQAFKRGAECRSLYTIDEASLLETTVAALRAHVEIAARPRRVWTAMRFGFYALGCLAILTSIPLFYLQQRYLAKPDASKG